MHRIDIDKVDVRWTQEDDGLSCVAVAEVSYQINAQKDRRIQWFDSGGLYGVDRRGSQAYLNQIASEQLEDLREHLAHFGIKPTDQEWQILIVQSPAGARRHGAVRNTTADAS